jgi:hypothetical protein
MLCRDKDSRGVATSIHGFLLWFPCPFDFSAQPQASAVQTDKHPLSELRDSLWLLDVCRDPTQTSGCSPILSRKLLSFLAMAAYRRAGRVFHDTMVLFCKTQTELDIVGINLGASLLSSPAPYEVGRCLNLKRSECTGIYR